MDLPGRTPITEPEQIFSLRFHTEQASDRSPLQTFFLANDIHAFLQPAKAGGAGRDRTDDPLLAKQVLSQLSYGP